MQESTLNRSVLFADIAGSSRIYEQLGDDRARRLIMTLLGEFSDVARKHNGESLRTYGDEMMCAFVSADDAVVAAATMHQVMDARSHSQKNDIELIGLYIRIDTGTVIRVGNKLFGDAVNSAAKMKTLAKPGQTLISETTLLYLTEENRQLTRPIGKLPIKGKSGTFDIFEYIHEEEDATLVMELPGLIKLSADVLELKHGDSRLIVDETRPSITIGRLPANDLVLKFAGVSRMHARIEHRRGKFVLVDASSNGTYVHMAEKDAVYLKHDELQLYGEGIICPGRSATANSPGAIHYAIRPGGR
jgi:class 3 adenylate cyclase